MKVNNYPLKTPAAGDKLFGSDASGDQKQFDMSNFGTSTYKVYTALLTQIGTNNPVATVLENTVGSIIWTRDSTGTYVGTLTGAFTTDKTFLLTSQTQGKIVIGRPNVNTLVLYSYNSGGSLSDGALGEFTSLEVRVYN